MFDETGTERTVETVESSTEAMEQANLELTTETMGQEGLEQGAGQENLGLGGRRPGGRDGRPGPHAG